MATKRVDALYTLKSIRNVVNVENTTTVLPTTTDLPVTTRILRNRANTSTKVDKVKRLKAPAKPPVELQKRRGRPPKNTPALSVQ